ncbi:MAG: hypothetical protein WBD67_02360 [Terracidiphilus sp.]
MKKIVLLRRKILAAVAICAAVVIGLGLMWVWRFEHNARAPIDAAMKVARGSAKLQKAIGMPMKAERLALGNLIASDGDGTADLVVRIEGPDDRGALDEWAQEVAGEWRVCSLAFQPRDGGAKLTLVDDATTNCERE